MSSTIISSKVDLQKQSDSESPDTNEEARPVFGCHHCLKVFNRRENLSRHLKTHDATPSHKCSKCSKAFTRSDLLKKHEAGHERWDVQEPRESESAKRRKIDFDEKYIQTNSSTTPWSSQPGRTSPLPHLNTSETHPAINSSSEIAETLADRERTPTALLSNLHYHAPLGSHVLSNPRPEISNYGHHEPPAIDQSDILQSIFPDCSNFNNTGPFDFSSFLINPNPGPAQNEWFSNDFYSAIGETGNMWGSPWDFLGSNFLSPGQDGMFVRRGGVSQDIFVSEVIPAPVQTHTVEEDEEVEEPVRVDDGRISRLSSPPNEASEDDKWPFQWNPNTRRILTTHPITIPNNHPLLKDHDSRFDISEATLLKLRAFLHPPTGRELHQSQKGSIMLPSLPVINVFISLFFKHFSPQAPVLHHATTNTNADLPPPLLAAIVTIGSIYSHIEHTRRFAIVLLDIVRWHLQIALECDNSLMRDPMIIYAEALICHAGLWCGNKRAYELAESMRGAVITHIRRRVNLHNGSNHAPAKENVQAQWRQWISKESERRLYWVIYTIDCQFPSLLNLPATISIGEVSNLGCPCDEEFWCAGSAREWKSLLGPPTSPPSRSFSAAVGPFVLTASSSPLEWSAAGKPSSLPVLDLNSWSSFLVLMALQSQVFQFSQEALLARTFIYDEECPEPEGDLNQSEAIANAENALKTSHRKRREQLAASLFNWSRAYISPPSGSTTRPTSQYFYSSSLVIHYLSTILLDVDLSDLQNAIGKSGHAGIAPALQNLTQWATKSPAIAQRVVGNAARTVVSLASNRQQMNDCAPYSIITIFLCHVVIWAFAMVCTEPQKGRCLAALKDDEVLRTSPFFLILVNSFESGDTDARTRDKVATKLLFKSAAEMLTQLGTWGASLNLALLLYRRAEL